MSTFNPDNLANLGFDGMYVTRTAGETLAFAEVCYLATTGKYKKARANTTNTMRVVAMATATLATDASGTFLLKGYIRSDAWTMVTASVKYCSAATAGLMTSTRATATGSQIQVLGHAETSVIKYFEPDKTLVTI